MSYDLNSPKRTSSRVPVLFHSSWTTPVLGFGFEKSVRVKLIDCGPCSRSSVQTQCMSYGTISPADRLTRQEPACFRRLKPFGRLSPYVLKGVRRPLLQSINEVLTIPAAMRLDSSNVVTGDQLRLSRIWICCGLSKNSTISYHSHLVIPATDCKKHSTGMPNSIPNAKTGVRIWRKSCL
jgi:hypothetical protein